jgi:hypothetical protein
MNEMIDELFPDDFSLLFVDRLPIMAGENNEQSTGKNRKA